MHVVGSLDLTYRRYRQLALASRRGRRAVMRAVGVLLAICDVALWQGSTVSTRVASVLVICLALFGIEGIVGLGWLANRSIAKAGPFRYEITDEGVTIRTAGTEASARWDGISRARKLRTAWYFVLATTGRPLPVPRAAFSSADQVRIDDYLLARSS
jgi:hypothetical protein